MVNIIGNVVAQKFVGKKFSPKVFLSLQMCTFRIWTLETAIIQGNLWLSWKKL